MSDCDTDMDVSDTDDDVDADTGTGDVSDVDAVAPPPPSLLLARERQSAAVRWLRPLAIAVIGTIVAVASREHPQPALGGSGVVVAIALIVLVAATACLVLRASSTATHTVTVVALIGASAALVWMQPGGPGVAGLFLAVSFAAMRSSTPQSLVALVLALSAGAAAGAHGQRSAGAILGVEIGIVAFFLIALFARRTRDAQEQTERLLVELQASRRVQAEAAALRERSRLAREMHDVLAHSLSGMLLQLEGARMLSTRPDANGQLPAALDRAHRLARAGLEEARRAIGALRDEELPGPERLEQLAADFQRDSRIEALLVVTGTPRRLESETSLTLYRVAQEALTNAAKHARAERVELRLDYEADGTRLVVEDHGERTAVARRPNGGQGAGYGLTGMRERAELLGGRFDASPTSDGFRVDLWIPA